MWLQVGILEQIYRGSTSVESVFIKRYWLKGSPAGMPGKQGVFNSPTNRKFDTQGFFRYEFIGLKIR
jgi:hypothetical protein